MRILLASGEVHPYSKTGGLADMVGALAKALSRAGHQVGLVSPLYQGITKRFPAVKPTGWSFGVPLGTARLMAEVYQLAVSDNLNLYFIDQPRFFDRAQLYTEENVDYPDNAQRYIFLSKCVTHLARHLPWQPEIVHVHDWQTGLVPLLIQHQKTTEGWRKTPRTCFTIHNQVYQGNFPWTDYQATNLPWDYYRPEGVEFYGNFNCLKAGIVFADAITTVSPRYAREITTPEYGAGLDGVLQQRLNVLTGILNGVDYEEWNTTNNPALPHAYSVEDLSGKKADKHKLQEELSLPVNADVPLFATIGRLVQQKGHDIALGALEEMLPAGLQFALLGNGDPTFEQGYRDLAKRYPNQVSLTFGFNPGLAHRIEAGADFFLMPSRFEPCGLNQMYSLRYGTVPIVRATGGLDDTVVDLNDNEDKANGIKFSEYSSPALAKTIRKALALYGEPDLLQHYRENGMRADFSWDRTAETFIALFKKTIRNKG